MADFLVDFPGLGIFDLPINRTMIEFNLFGRDFSIYWYGVLIAFAFFLCIFLSMRAAPKFGLEGDSIADYYLLIIPLAMLGSRLYYVAFEWDSYRGNIGKIFDLRTGGLAFYGGVIGGVLAVIIMAAIKKQRLSRIADFLAVYLPLGQAIGRWGNFFNQEAFGVNTNLPWGMYSNGTRDYLASLTVNEQSMLPAIDPSKPVHPTFLYEFVANMLIFFILLQVRKRSKRPFTTLASYLFMYGLVRFLVEGLRTDPLYIGTTDLRVSQLLSALMIVFALIILVASSLIKQRHPDKIVTVALADQPTAEAATDELAAEEPKEAAAEELDEDKAFPEQKVKAVADLTTSEEAAADQSTGEEAEAKNEDRPSEEKLATEEESSVADNLAKEDPLAGGEEPSGEVDLIESELEASE